MIILTNSNIVNSTLEDDVSNTESLKNEATFCHLLLNYWLCMKGFTEAQCRLLFNFQNSGAYPHDTFVCCMISQ
jgi:hypothetical protein